MTSTPDTAPHLPLDQFTVWREAQDTRARSGIGSIYYVIAWTVSWWLSINPLESLVPGLAGTAFFLALVAARMLHRLPDTVAPQPLQRWLDQHWVLLWAASVGWGLSYAFMLLDAHFVPLQLVGAISSVAFSTAIALTFPMNRRRVLVAVTLMYLPGLLVLASDWATQKPIFLNLVIYLSYLVLSIRRGSTEYRVHAGMEHELLEQRSRLQHLSRTDSLTQLGNRYQFTLLFEPLVAQAQRNGGPLSLLLFDIDFFKKINDRHGHAGGDRALQAFADVLRERFPRESDVLARLGGEEFAVLMPHTTQEDALRLAEAFREDLAARRPDWSGEQLALTTSVGVGTLQADDGGAEAFMRRVDEALYRAKGEGRNRSVLADTPMPELEGAGVGCSSVS